jgi:hypothetical protein
MKLAAVLPLLLVAGTANADLFECDHKAPHRLTANVEGASRIVVIGRAGSLKVRGAGQSNVTASGTACSNDRDFLSGMRLEARREGSDVVVEAIIPEKTTVFGLHQASIDFEVVVPQNLAVSVKDGSGSIEITGVASLEVRDGSGSIEISDVRGDVDVTDGSGSVSAERIGGTFRVLADGSGSIDVTDVRGDFIVERDGSGGIDYSRVGGQVRIPERKR